MESRKTLLLMVLSALMTGRMLAAPPPTLVNYQGVLRSSADAPLTGTYDMEFRFWDAATAGVEIMVDQHTAAGANAVTVAGGLFDVPLGGGTVTDGSGPGTYTSLDAVFRDHSGVWLEIAIGGETLTPRTRIHSAPYSLNATNAADSTQLAGQPASSYLDTSATAQTKLGRVLFDNAAGSGEAIEAIGPGGGGTFRDSDGSAYSFVGRDGYGIEGYGNTMGAYFQDANNSGLSYVGYGDYGIQSYGNTAGGYFQDRNSSGLGYAGLGEIGFEGYGNGAGGYFKDRDSSGYAYVGYDHGGIRASGNSYGGFFEDPEPGGGYAYVGIGTSGIEAYGTYTGGFFRDFSGSYAYVGYSLWKIQGTGTVSFVQNHPTQKDRVIVYAAPEGDEVAVYTRGSGRLVNGQARVALGETFALVANPDVGLTAHLTPRGESPLALTVAAVSTNELIVRGPAGAEVDFDYIVYGLRIGFEAMPTVQVKNQEAYLPTAATLAELEAGQADAVASSALARYRASHERLAGAPADLSRANALAAQVNAGREEWFAASAKREEERRAALTQPRETGAAPLALPAQHPDAAREVAAKPTPTIEVATETPGPPGTTLVLRALVTTEIGEVVSLDPLHPGTFVRSSTPGEALIVGCALVGGDGDIAIATAGVALCRVDASLASIDVGDFLVASSIEGHAMKHDGTLPTPAILGRAVDPLPVGAGLIRVLLGAR